MLVPRRAAQTNAARRCVAGGPLCFVSYAYYGRMRTESSPVSSLTLGWYVRPTLAVVPEPRTLDDLLYLGQFFAANVVVTVYPSKAAAIEAARTQWMEALAYELQARGTLRQSRHFPDAKIVRIQNCLSILEAAAAKL
jgi:hypothetical protein